MSAASALARIEELAAEIRGWSARAAAAQEQMDRDLKAATTAHERALLYAGQVGVGTVVAEAVATCARLISVSVGAVKSAEEDAA